MPFAFLFVGILLLIVAIRGQQNYAASLLKSEFTGTGNFVVWISAIAILGMIGYIKQIRPVTDAFIGLVLLSLVYSNSKGGQNLFSEFNQQIRNPVAPPAAATHGGSGGSANPLTTGNITAPGTQTSSFSSVLPTLPTLPSFSNAANGQTQSGAQQSGFGAFINAISPFGGSSGASSLAPYSELTNQIPF